MTKQDGKAQREIRKIRNTGVRHTEALARVQRGFVPAGSCPDCGSYDLDTEHGGGGQSLRVCNACEWSEG